jgi:hypothetical protein
MERGAIGGYNGATAAVYEDKLTSNIAGLTIVFYSEFIPAI